jgi:tetratricopeptide (TPR) repeat protein
VSPTAKAAIKTAFAATGAPYADSAADSAATVLGRYADVLASATTAVCKDDHAPPVRAHCLDEHRTQLAAFVDRLAHADAGLVQRAPDTAWSLFEPEPCARPDMRRPLAKEDQIELDRVHDLGEVGNYKVAVDAAEKLLEKARGKGDKELELVTLHELAEDRQQLESTGDVATLYHQAEALAEALGHDDDAAMALEALANVEGLDKHDYAAAHADLDLAKAKLQRLGDTNLALRGQVLTTEAQVLTIEGRLGEAETTMKAAIAALKQAVGPDHPRVAIAMAVLSQIEDPLNKEDEALSAARGALDTLTRAYGEHHPTVAGSQMQLAGILIKVQQYDEARQLLMKADATFARVFGADHESRAQIYANLGALETAQNHFASATAAYRVALQVLEKTNGPKSEEAAGARRDIAYTLALAQKMDEAIPEAERGIAVRMPSLA